MNVTSFLRLHPGSFEPCKRAHINPFGPFLIQCVSSSFSSIQNRGARYNDSKKEEFSRKSISARRRKKTNN